jgi:hypothetical protein
MDNRFTKVTAYGLIGSIISMSAASFFECERRELCEIKAAELPHMHERDPGPMRTVDLKPVAAITLSTASMDFRPM